MIEKTIYSNIVKIIEEPFKEKEEKPKIHNLKENYKNVTTINLPKRKNLFSGTSFLIICNDRCHIRGDLVAYRYDEKEDSNKIENLHCEITSIHEHPESVMAIIPGKEYVKESHIHFKCYSKSYSDTLKIIKFLRNY